MLAGNKITKLTWYWFRSGWASVQHVKSTWLVLTSFFGARGCAKQPFFKIYFNSHVLLRPICATRLRHVYKTVGQALVWFLTQSKTNQLKGESPSGCKWKKKQENKEYKNSNKLKGCWLNVWVAEIPHKTNMSSCTDLVRDPNHATN